MIVFLAYHLLHPLVVDVSRPLLQSKVLLLYHDLRVISLFALPQGQSLLLST